VQRAQLVERRPLGARLVDLAALEALVLPLQDAAGDFGEVANLGHAVLDHLLA